MSQGITVHFKYEQGTTVKAENGFTGEIDSLMYSDGENVYYVAGQEDSDWFNEKLLTEVVE